MGTQIAIVVAATVITTVAIALLIYFAVKSYRARK